MNELMILVVEDDEIDQIAFKRLVQAQNLPYHCTYVRGVAAAQRLLQGFNFDLALLDYHLEDGTGLDLLPHLAGTPAIFVTGLGDEEVAVRAMKSGAADYLVKDSDGGYLKILPTIIESALQRSQAEQRIRALESERLHARLIQEFIQNISHDLRTPLTGLMLSTYLVQRHAELLPVNRDDAEINQHIQEIKIHSANVGLHAHRLQDITEASIEMVRLDVVGNLELRPQDLNYTLKNLAQQYQPFALAKSIQLTLTTSPTPLMIAAQMDELEVLITQLLKNALQFTPAGGSITLRGYAYAGEVFLEVQDTGKGISDQHLPLVFERFYRGTHARETDTGGMGLGLTMVKRIAELHQARIALESTVGRGTLVRIIFQEWQ